MDAILVSLQKEREEGTAELYRKMQQLILKELNYFLFLTVSNG